MNSSGSTKWIDLLSNLQFLTIYFSFWANSTLWINQQNRNCEKKFFDIVDQNEDYQAMIYANKDDESDDRHTGHTRPKRSRTDLQKNFVTQVNEIPVSPKKKLKSISPMKSSLLEDKQDLILFLKNLGQIQGKLEAISALLQCNEATKSNIFGFNAMSETIKDSMAIIKGQMGLVQARLLSSNQWNKNLILFQIKRVVINLFFVQIFLEIGLFVNEFCIVGEFDYFGFF